ncbi:MAG TPA: M20/M25/M40 family metallo-hydrolase [Chitinophagaceae bacterium]|nr:M20/M25/M40 family metallo-hydrolase [Chitinophagaceae bacterium]
MKFIHTGMIWLLVLAPAFLFAQTENIDQAMMQRIRKEGMENSKVMDIAFRLTDANGPRLTASPGFLKAANWAKDQLRQWGLVNATLDPWGDFGKSWELQKSYIAMTAPWYRSLQAYPKVWTGGSNGLKNADVILITAKDSAGLDAVRGKLKGKIILLDRSDSYNMSFKADASRYTDAELDTMANWKPQPVDTAAARRRREQFQRAGGGGGQRAMLATLNSLAVSEGAVGMLSTSPRNHDGTIYVQQAGAYKVTDPENFLDIAIGFEDYMTMVRLLRNNIPVKMDVDVQTKFYSSDTKGYNVLAEIKGTDKNLKDEVVMLGGHLDSWVGGTGATDNAAGCAIMMEAVRILKTVGVSPKRTIRIALWSGEEQGLFGSRGYVKKTFADPADMKLLPAHEKFSSYFNVDNGTGKIRGIYLQGNEAARNIFAQWLTPFNDLGAKTVTLNNTSGTDHQSFDAVGLPGFQFIQEPMEYDTRTHHSNMDTYEHLSEADLKQAATIVAAFVYNAAMRDQKIPRKELPKPRPAGQRGF